MTIAESLQDAHRIQTTLDQVRISLCQVIYVQIKWFVAFSRTHQHGIKVTSMDFIWFWTFHGFNFPLTHHFYSDVIHSLRHVWRLEKLLAESECVSSFSRPQKCIMFLEHIENHILFTSQYSTIMRPVRDPAMFSLNLYFHVCFRSVIFTFSSVLGGIASVAHCRTKFYIMPQNSRAKEFLWVRQLLHSIQEPFIHVSVLLFSRDRNVMRTFH